LRVTESLPVTAYVECLAGTSGVVTTGSYSVGATLAPTNTGVASAGCKWTQGEILVGYGFDIDGAGLELYRITPVWDVEVSPFDATLLFGAINRDSVEHVLHGYAYCLTNVAAMPSYLPTVGKYAIPGGQSGSTVGSCATGYGTVIGGGMNYYDAATNVVGGLSYVGNPFSMKMAPTGWRADFYAESTFGHVSIGGDVTNMCLLF
jgi:hypothetical protein